MAVTRQQENANANIASSTTSSHLRILLSKLFSPLPNSPETAVAELGRLLVQVSRIASSHHRNIASSYCPFQQVLKGIAFFLHYRPLQRLWKRDPIV